MSPFNHWIMAYFMSGVMAGLAIAHFVVPEIERAVLVCEPCPEIDTDAQAVLLMEECVRCKRKEAKNWVKAAHKRRKELKKCRARKDAGATCGPFNWTCEESLYFAASQEEAYLDCAGPWQAMPMLHFFAEEYKER